MEGRPRRLLLAMTLLSALGAGVVLAHEGRQAATPKQQSTEFQKLVGGLGTGPAVDLSTCPGCFDARLGIGCGVDLECIPAGHVFCTHHAHEGPRAVFSDEGETEP